MNERDLCQCIRPPHLFFPPSHGLPFLPPSLVPFMLSPFHSVGCPFFVSASGVSLGASGWSPAPETCFTQGAVLFFSLRTLSFFCLCFFSTCKKFILSSVLQAVHQSGHPNWTWLRVGDVLCRQEVVQQRCIPAVILGLPAPRLALMCLQLEMPSIRMDHEACPKSDSK